MKKRILSVMIVAALALSMTACGAAIDETAAEVDVITTVSTALKADEEKEESKAEETEKEAEETTVEETEAETTAETKPEIEIVDVPVENFETQYDASLGGLIITKYNGGEAGIRVPAEIDGDPVLAIGYRAFYYTNSVKKIELSEGITTIYESGLSSGTLEEVIFPESLTILGNSAFAECRSLKEITIPNTITEFGTNMFDSCYALETVTLQDNITELPEETFYK